VRRILAVAAAALVLAAGCGQAADDTDPQAQDDTRREGPTITVGSEIFTESVIIAEIYAQGLEAKGYDVAKKLRIGSREVYYPALEKGEIDLVPEYTGSLLSYLTKQKKTASPDSQKTYDDVTAELEGKDVTLLEMSDAQDQDAIVVNKETAEKYDLTTISDLQPHASELVMGGPPECPTRQACLKGLQDVYDIDFREFKPLDSAGPQTVRALMANEIQVANLFSTQSAIPKNDFVVLEDDKGPIVGAENVVAAVNRESMQAQDDEFAEIVNAITTKFTTEGLLELNSRVDNDQEDADDVAADWLAEEDLA
jgi:osmoprotectant transport system substrate-binding protein